MVVVAGTGRGDVGGTRGWHGGRAGTAVGGAAVGGGRSGGGGVHGRGGGGGGRRAWEGLGGEDEMRRSDRFVMLVEAIGT